MMISYPQTTQNEETDHSGSRVRKVIMVTGGKRVQVKLKLFSSVYNAESNLVKLT